MLGLELEVLKGSKQQELQITLFTNFKNWGVYYFTMEESHTEETPF